MDTLSQLDDARDTANETMAELEDALALIEDLRIDHAHVLERHKCDMKMVKVRSHCAREKAMKWKAEAESVQKELEDKDRRITELVQERSLGWARLDELRNERADLEKKLTEAKAASHDVLYESALRGQVDDRESRLVIMQQQLARQHGEIARMVVHGADLEKELAVEKQAKKAAMKDAAHWQRAAVPDWCRRQDTVHEESLRNTVVKLERQIAQQHDHIKLERERCAVLESERDEAVRNANANLSECGKLNQKNAVQAQWIKAAIADEKRLNDYNVKVTTEKNITEAEVKRLTLQIEDRDILIKKVILERQAADANVMRTKVKMLEMLERNSELTEAVKTLRDRESSLREWMTEKGILRRAPLLDTLKDEWKMQNIRIGNLTVERAEAVAEAERLEAELADSTDVDKMRTLKMELAVHRQFNDEFIEWTSAQGVTGDPRLRKLKAAWYRKCVELETNLCAINDLKGALDDKDRLLALARVELMALEAVKDGIEVRRRGLRAQRDELAQINQAMKDDLDKATTEGDATDELREKVRLAGEDLHRARKVIESFNVQNDKIRKAMFRTT